MRYILCTLLLTSAVAHAQTTGTGSCTGTTSPALTAQIGVGVLRSGNYVSVNATQLNNVFGQAECLCDDPTTETNDLQLEILISQPLPTDANGSTLEVWIGSGCDNYQTRISTTSTSCKKISTSLTAQQFLTGVASTTTILRTPISASTLSNLTDNTCSGETVSRSIYVFIFKDPSAPLASCTFNTSIKNTGPAGPGSVSAESGDQAVSVKWKPPAATEQQPLYFQLLCASADGTAVPKKSSSDQSYSTCLPGGDFRQRNTLPIGGNSIGAGDMGTTTLPDLRTARFEPLSHDDSGVHPPLEDLGTEDLAGDDLLPLPANGYRGETTTSLESPFTNLDPAYLCSPPISATTTEYTARIDSLVNGQTYKFVVLAVDLYGNVTPSAVLSATPAPVENFYRRYVQEGGTANGFCSASGGAASGLTMLAALGALLGLRHRRRIAAWWERQR